MSEGVGEARAEAEGELALARVAWSDGDLRHAAVHLAHAVAADPSLPTVYAVLHELDAAVGGALDLFPVDEGSYIGVVAARSYLLARRGGLDEAFQLVCAVAGIEPGKPWAAPGWLEAPGLASRLDPQRATSSLMRLALRLPDPAEAHLLPGLMPFLDVARGLVAAHPGRTDILASLSSLARRLGAVEEAITWCQRAEQAEQTWADAAMLGYALRNAGRFDEMHEAWLRALSRDPGNVNLHVDIAEQLAARGRRAEGLTWLDKALALEPEHPKAFPSACQMRYAEDGDIAHLVQLADWWRDHPEHGYAGHMLAKACRDQPWLRVVPPPSEAICNMLVEVAARFQGQDLSTADLEVTLSALEVPSAIAAAKAALPRIRIVVSDVPEPDIRVPLAEGRYRVWAYHGTQAVPAVPPPSPAAAATLRDLAAAGHPPHPVAAYDAAVALSRLGLDDLLGLLAHIPPIPDHAQWQQLHREHPAFWPRLAQAWTCLGMLHFKTDQPWPASARRSVLIDLARGIEDWTTDAALNAMVVAAWADPAIRGEVAEIVGHRFLDALQALRHREVTIARSLASLTLATPAMNPDVTRLARHLLAHSPDRLSGQAAADSAAQHANPAPARRRLLRRHK